MLRKIETSLAILIFPFRSLILYKKDLFLEIALSQAKEKPSTKAVVNHLWNNLNLDFKPHNVDEVKLTLQKHYPFIFEHKEFDKSYVMCKYFDTINKLSTSLISHRDGKITYKYWNNKNDKEIFGPYDTSQKIIILNSLSRMMPLDIVAINYLLENNMDDIDQLDGFYSSIMLADMQLEDTLVSGVAENHLHAGACFNFAISWNIVMNIFLRGDVAYIKQLGIPTTLVHHTISSIILRLTLCIFLSEKYNRSDKCHKNFEDWISEFNCKTNFSQDVSDRVNNESSKEYYSNNARNEKLIYDFITTLSFGEDISKWIKDRSITSHVDSNELDFSTYKELWEIMLKRHSIDIEENSQDFVFDIFHRAHCVKTYGENVFIFYALKYIKEEKNDTMFSQLFLNYLRIRTNFFNHIVQNGATVKGLDYFKKFYHTASKSIAYTNTKHYYKTLFRTMFQDNFLKKLELRTSINIKSFREDLINILSAYKEVIDEDFLHKNNENINKDYHEIGEDTFPLFGLVIHLLKKEDIRAEEKCWHLHNKDTQSTAGELYFGLLQEEYISQVEALVSLRNEFPHLSQFILGLDAASGENDTPISVFAPVFDKARGSNGQTLKSRDKNSNLIKNKSLAFTFHAGEDFRHLLSGLRRIDEVIEFCKFHAGDRIGHGIALGVDTEYWRRTNPVVILPRGEYLDNLLWVWGIYANEKDYDPKINIYLENQIYTYASEVYENMNGITTPMLFKAYENRFKKFEVNKKYIDNESNSPEIFCIRASDADTKIWNADKLNHVYHCKCYLKKLYEPIQVAVTDIDCGMILKIQEIIRKKVATKGIVVEVNPTSNVVIGEMDSLFDHHAYIINNILESKNTKIMLNVNSDDPTVFNTNVSNELAYLYYGLLHKNVCKEDALAWIDKVRDYGIKTSFINNQISHREYYQCLKDVLDTLGANN